MRTRVPNTRAARMRCAPRPGRLAPAGYVVGTNGNDCPAGYARIETEPACRTAAAALGDTFDGSIQDAGIPRGCFLDLNDNDLIFFNTHIVGRLDVAMPVICIGAPPFPDSPNGRRPRLRSMREPQSTVGLQLLQSP